MFGKVGRFSILYLMAIVLLVAIDCGLLRSSFNNGLFALFLMILPTVNVMIMAMPRLRQSRTWRRFWIGFDVVVVTFAILISASFLWAPFVMIWPIIWLGEHGWISENNPAQFLLTIGVVLAIYSIPQFLIAILVGLFHEKLRLASVRRSRLRDPQAFPSTVES